MNIAVLGWGSLIWRPGVLRLRTRWRRNGPKLPIEFARVSADRSVTLVIHNGADHQRCYWALSEFSEIADARANLKERERCPKIDPIHFLDAGSSCADAIQRMIFNWLSEKPEINAAIWTGLPSNWKQKRGKEFSCKEVVCYLRQLEADYPAAFARAREYVQNAPSQIQTKLRQRLRSEFGWSDNALPCESFE